MSNKVSDCDCNPHDQVYYGGHKPTCSLAEKPCGVKSEPELYVCDSLGGYAKHKPIPAPDRLLNDEEINEVTIWCNHPAEIPKAIAQAQDVKTASLKDAEIAELKATHKAELARVFQDLENYQVSVRNGSKIIYGSNFQAVKDKYLPTSQTGDKKND